jgi:hypothetical protein
MPLVTNTGCPTPTDILLSTASNGHCPILIPLKPQVNPGFGIRTRGFIVVRRRAKGFWGTWAIKGTVEPLPNQPRQGCADPSGSLSKDGLPDHVRLVGDDMPVKRARLRNQATGSRFG